MAPDDTIDLIIVGDNGSAGGLTNSPGGSVGGGGLVNSPGNSVGGGGLANSPGGGGGGGGGRAEAWKNGCYYKFLGVITYSFSSIGLGSTSRSDYFFRSGSKSLVDEDA